MLKTFPFVAFLSCILSLASDADLLHGEETEASAKHNILMIAVDDLKTIGSLYKDDPGNFLNRVYPDPALRQRVANRMTPNLNRLAACGVTFTNAHCAAPACNPSRAALMTGIRPSDSGLTTNAGGRFFRDYQYNGKATLSNAITLPQWLKEKGWYTATTGKIFHNGGSYRHADGERSWTQWTNVPGNAGSKTRDAYSPKSLDWGREGDSNSTFHELNDYRKADFIATLFEEGRTLDGETEFILPENQPFFIACGIFRPHLPFYATQDLLDLFPTDEMSITQELLEEFTEDANDLPQVAFKWCGLSLNEKGHPVIGKDRFVDILNHGRRITNSDGHLVGWKRMLQHYFASCAIADRCVGRLLDGLQSSQSYSSTTIILWSDHGYHLGEKLHETKFTLWDDSTNVNLLIADPQQPSTRGEVCDSPVSLLDLFPTVCNRLQVGLPNQQILGNDLSPLLANPKAHWPHPVITTYESVKSNMIMHGDYKLIRYDEAEPSYELYDLKKDPQEFENLAGLAEYKDQVIRLLEMLEDELAR